MWENLGWHYSIRHEATQSQIHETVFPNAEKREFVLLTDYNRWQMPQIQADGPTLVDCIRNARNRAIALSKYAQHYAEALT